MKETSAIRAHLALERTLSRLPAGMTSEWITTAAIASDSLAALDGCHGVWMAPGTPYTSLAGALAAISHAQTRPLPLLGTCGGFQHVAHEYARNVVGVADAAHAELSPEAATAVIVPLTCSLVGERRWARAVPGTRAADICGSEAMDGYHVCAYGLASNWIPRLEAAALVISGHTDHGGVEIIELPGHPFYIATAFQPRLAPEGVTEQGPQHPLIGAFRDAVMVAATAVAIAT